MNHADAPERLAQALDLALAGSPAGVAEDDEVFELLAAGAFLRESLTPAPAPEPFRSSLREWLESRPRRRWWEDALGPLRRRMPISRRAPAVGVAVGAGAAAAIVIGVLVARNRRSSRAGLAG